jgi:NADH-quinone oxidoreductase subunit G
MAVVYVNNQPIDIGSEKLNLIQAAQKAGVLIPHYCWHAALTVVASCRMCLVEAGERKPDGTVVMQPKVVPACQTPARDGTVVRTNSERAVRAQQQTLESLLLNHPLDCPVCDKAGECSLQDYSYRFGRAESRIIDSKNHPPNKPSIGANIDLFADRCIMCSRCVRFTREISGTAELQVINRGDHSEIDVFPGEPCNNRLAGNVVDLCPVGALCSKDFLYKQRVWYLQSQKSVCADCSTGCSIFVDHNKDIVYRLRPRENPRAQGFFMCDLGRLNYHYVNSAERLRRPMVRANGALQEVEWPAFLAGLRQRLGEMAARGGMVGVLSPFLTCEEAFLLATYLKALDASVQLALGPVPIHGQDDTYPKNRKGQPIEPVRFTIRAEKCPNRRGVEEVLRHLQGEMVGFDRVLKSAAGKEVKAVYFAGAYPPGPKPWPHDGEADRLGGLDLLVVHELVASPLTQRAHFVVPAASYAEKDGTFVNHAGLAQPIRAAVRQPPGCRTDGQVFLDLLQRRGLVHAPTLRAEMAATIPYFAKLADGHLDELGVVLTAP